MSSKSCILVVGSTGTGKSTLIGMCTGLSVATSGGSNECTQDIQEFEDEEGLMWVDSVGFDGTDSTRSDEEAFQYILRFLQEHGISHVAGIIWTVNPDGRMTAKLQKQAWLINQFKAVSVWDNVIIAVKKTRGNARTDGAGALAAAGEYCDKDSLKTIGYTLIEQLDHNEKQFWEKQSDEDRTNMGILTNGEAKTLIKEALTALPQLFQVVFWSSKCADCGVVSDPRLLPLACHTAVERVHPQAPLPIHRGATALTHPVTGIATRHTRPVEQRKVRKGGNRVIGRTYTYVPHYYCCGRDVAQNPPGCQAYHPCCNQPQGAQGCKNIFTCCGVEGKLVSFQQYQFYPD